MAFPVYNFNDPDLDYAEVEANLHLMFTQVWSKSRTCCKNKPVAGVLSDVSVTLQVIEIDRGNTPKYQDDVRTAYLQLYPFA